MGVVVNRDRGEETCLILDFLVILLGRPSYNVGARASDKSPRVPLVDPFSARDTAEMIVPNSTTAERLFKFPFCSSVKHYLCAKNRMGGTLSRIEFSPRSTSCPHVQPATSIDSEETLHCLGTCAQERCRLGEFVRLLERECVAVGSSNHFSISFKWKCPHVLSYISHVLSEFKLVKFQAISSFCAEELSGSDMENVPADVLRKASMDVYR